MNRPSNQRSSPLLRFRLGNLIVTITRVTQKHLHDAPLGSHSAGDVEEQFPSRASTDKELSPLFRVTVATLIALFLAYLAQFVYLDLFDYEILRTLPIIQRLEITESIQLWVGSLLYLFSVPLFIWSIARMPPYVIRYELAHNTFTQKGLRRATLNNVLTILGLLVAIYAMLRFYIVGEEPSTRWFWLAGIVLFLFAQFLSRKQYQPQFPSGKKYITGPIHLVILMGILTVAIWLRFNQLGVLPQDLHGDMALYGIQARQYLTGVEWQLFRSGWAEIPLIGYLPYVLTMRIFGNNLYGLSMGALIGSIISLIGFYFLIWRSFDSHRLASIALAILAINIPHIHFSRIPAYMDPWPFNVWGLYFLVDGLRNRNRLSLTVAGLLVGLGVQMYYSGRVIVFIILAYLIYLLLFHRRWIFHNVFGLALAAMGFVVSAGINLIYYSKNIESLLSRTSAVVITNPAVMTHLLDKYGVESATDVIFEQIKRSLLMFHYSIDSSTQFGLAQPMFSWLIAPLIVLGFGYLLWNLREPGPGLFLVYWATMLTLGSILTNNAPFWPRLVGMPLVGALFAAVALERLWAMVEERFTRAADRPSHRDQSRHKNLGMVNIVVALLIGGLVSIGAIRNWDLYYDAVHANARPQAIIGRYLSGLPSDVTACSFSGRYQLEVQETAFLAWPRSTVDLPYDAPGAAIEACPGPPLTWIVYPEQEERLAEIRNRWPDGQLTEHQDRSGQLIFRTYQVDQGRASEGYRLDAPVSGTHQVEREMQSLSAVAAITQDGNPFRPLVEYLGNTDSRVWEIDHGKVSVTGGVLRLQIGPLTGHNAVLDYVKLVDASGAEVLIEAEKLSQINEDGFSAKGLDDGKWWLQKLDVFSEEAALVAQRTETVPVLNFTIEVADGEYSLFLGSFTGDPANGVFGLGLSILE